MPSRVSLGILAAVALTAAAPVEAGGPRIRVSKPPPGLRAGQTWNALVAVSGGRPSAFVIARGRAREAFPLTRRAGGYRARVVFFSPGRWRYGVRIGRKTHFVGSVGVRLRPPILLQPFGIIEEPAGTLLVADWRAGIVYRLDPSRRDGDAVTRIAAPRDLIRAPDGRILVASNDRVFELDPATGAVREVVSAEAFVGGISAAADGTLYLNEDASRIVRLAPNGDRTVLATGLNGVHGILLTPEGLVVCESFSGRVLRLDGTRLEVLAEGLGNPSYAARAADGALYVGEFVAGRVTRLDPSGETTVIASVANPGPVSLDRSGRILVGTLDGHIYRVDPAARTAVRIYP
jgi:outer membrane protein assembly factor BamB